MANDRTASRRRNSEEIKARVIAQCEVAGASVAKVAMSHGINANIVHRWWQLARRVRPVLPGPSGEFVPVSPAAPPASTATHDIQIQAGKDAPRAWCSGALALAQVHRRKATGGVQHTAHAQPHTTALSFLGDSHATRRAKVGITRPLEAVFAGPISGIEPAGPGLLPVSTIESEDTPCTNRS
jgi:transposase